MKVLILPSWYPHHYNYTEGIFNQRHAESVAKHTETDVIVLFVKNELLPGKKDFHIDYNLVNHVPTFIVYYSKSSFSPSRIWKYFKAYLIGYREIKQKFGQPDGTHVNVVMRAGLMALYLKMRHKIPYIITEHWSGYDVRLGYYKGFWFKLFTKWIVQCASAVITINHDIMRMMKRLGLNSEYFVIPNSVDTSLFKPAIQKIQNSKFRFIHISNFKPVKNADRLLHVVKALAQKRNDFNMVLAGGNTYMPPVLELKRQLALSDELIILKGKLTPGEVVKELQIADAFVLFSNNEGLPCIILEALAIGLPVISTGVGGIPDYINSKNGILIDSGDENALLEKMNWMIDYSQTFDSQLIRNFAISNFDEREIGKEIFSLYKKYFNPSATLKNPGR